MTTTISVALCTHNGSRFLPAQVGSICSQTRLPDEVVLSDDASSDGSVAIVQCMLNDFHAARPDARVELQVLENRSALGVVANFEQAVRHCRGSLIALCDQDDIWLPDRLMRLQREMERRPDLLLIHSDARLVDASGAPLGRTQFQALGMHGWEIERIHDGKALDVLLRASRVTGATAVIRRRLLEMALPFPAEWWHDEWLALVAASQGQLDVVEESLVDYRQHGGNAIGAPARVPLLDSVRMATEAGGNARRTRQLARAEVLLDRMSRLQPPLRPERLAAVGALVEHQRMRADLPASRLVRVVCVMRELISGRYRRFSYGIRSAIRDLLVTV